VANKTYSLKNQKKLKIFLEKQENDSKSNSKNNNGLSERTPTDKERLLRGLSRLPKSGNG
jgi:hypothetical protein